MSADNYIFVGKNHQTKKYEVSHRFASTYYRDELAEPPREYHSLTGTSKGWSVTGESGPWFETPEEAIKSSPLRPDWVVDPPTPRETFDDVDAAVKFAHKWENEEYVVEYGVNLSSEVLEDYTKGVTMA